MKKIMTIVAVVAIAGVVSADLSTKWLNSKIILQADSVNLLDGTKVQLIWSAGGIQTGAAGAYNVLGGAVLAGEFLLNETVTFGAGGGSPADFGLWEPVNSVYFNADVAGANINSGFFFTRIFQSSASAGEWFLDTGAVDASAWVFDAQNTATIYQGNAVPGADFTTLDLNSGGTSVIPEPATFGLMGIAGLGMFLARKKARR